MNRCGILGPGVRGRGFSTGLLALQCRDERGQQSTHSGSHAQRSPDVFRSDIAQPEGDQGLGLKLHERAIGYRQVMEILSRVLAPVPFCDIGGDRHRSPSKLCGQTVDFLLRKRPAHSVAFDDEIHGQAPDSEVPVALDPGCARSGHVRLKMVMADLHAVSFPCMEEHFHAMTGVQRAPRPQAPGPRPRHSP
jgi:hypothetical protein